MKNWLDISFNRAERAVPKLSRLIKKYRTRVDNRLQTPLKNIMPRPTKVAIIDNGILSISPRAEKSWGQQMARKRQEDTERASLVSDTHTIQREGYGLDDGKSEPLNSRTTKSYKTLWSRIEDGRSFVDDYFRVSPWLFASDPHGTQMADLICAIDPRCQLNVAKVTDGTDGITPKRVFRVRNESFGQKYSCSLREPICPVSLGCR